ncbi:hypothetical protein KCV01_g8808, partial [Aureobasidium melanogenum]
MVVALVDVAIARMTGVDVFTFMVWVFLPMGAIGAGFAAASGYYFGSRFFQKKPGKLLLLQMVVIAGFTQFLIYYVSYSTLLLEDGSKLSDAVPFSRYMDVFLSKSRYLMRYVGETGELGSAGYWIAGVQFVGFLVGGLGIYGVLAAKPVCGECSLYLLGLAKRKKFFLTRTGATHYYNGVFTHAFDSPDFATMLHADDSARRRGNNMTALIHTQLWGCPACKQQLIEEKVEVWNGSDWKIVNDLKRRVQVPAGMDLLPVFQGKTMPLLAPSVAP